MELDRVQYEHGASREHEDKRNGNAMEKPARTRTSHWKDGHRQQQWCKKERLKSNV